MNPFGHPAEHDPCAAFREDFSALIDDELAPARRAELEAHLEACGECRGLFEAMKRITDRFAAMPSVPAPEDFETRLRGALPARVEVHARGRRALAFVALAAAAGFALFVVPPLVRQTPSRHELDLAKKSAAEATPHALRLEPEASPAPTPEPSFQNAPEAAPTSEPVDSAEALMQKYEVAAAPMAEPALPTDSEHTTVGAGTHEVAAEPVANMTSIHDEASKTKEGATDRMQAQLKLLGYGEDSNQIPGKAAESAAPAPASPAPTPSAATMRHISSRARMNFRAEEKDSETWHAAGRDFVLEDNRWVEMGARGDAVPKVLSPGSREFKRLLREFPNLEELRSATRPVIFRVDKHWYELNPKKP